MLMPASHLGSKRSVSKVWTFDLPITSAAQTVVAGALAATVSVNVQSLIARSATFLTLFQEYRIVGARFRIRVLTPFTTPQGIISCYLNEKLSSAPTANESASSPRVEVPCLAYTADKCYFIDWVARDLLDLEFTPSATTVTPLYVKFYATGTNASTAGSLVLDGALRVQYRGLQ